MKKYEAPVKKQDGGFYFADYDVHVVATGIPEAKKIIKDTHGIDIDVDPNAEQVASTIDDEKSSDDTNE